MKPGASKYTDAVAPNEKHYSPLENELRYAPQPYTASCLLINYQFSDDELQCVFRLPSWLISWPTDSLNRRKSDDSGTYRKQNLLLPHLPSLWNEVHSTTEASRSSNLSESIHEKRSGSKTANKQSFEEIYRQPYPLPPHLFAFAPYVEKETLQPTDPANLNFDSRGIDIGAIRKWMLICTKRHGHDCDWDAVEGRAEGQSPLFLIDVVNMKIVHANPDSRYVTLSYVWGEFDSTCNDSQDASTLIPNTCFTGPAIAVPQVIRHSIELVQRLGEKFLWIDRLCIPQDDGAEKQAQLNAMGSIYARSWLTIIAAQNVDPSQGLYGTRELFEAAAKETSSFLATEMKGKSRRQVYNLSNEEVIVCNSKLLMTTPWYSRGWTFQEHLFSARRLVFQHDTVGWECQRSAWHEAQNLSTLLHSDIPASLHEPVGIHRMVLSPWPDMFRYARLVAMYNRRALSYPEDALDAFRGALALFGRSYIGPFISGLPEMFFDATLLWQPWFSMKRRRAKRCTEEDALLPSWSWIGWSGQLCSESWATAYSYMRPTHGRGIPEESILPWTTISTVDWSYSDKLGSERKRIAGSTQIYEELRNNHRELERNGWISYKDDLGYTFYRHQLEPSREFWYPIPPVVSPQVDNPLISARFIHGRTRTAELSIGQPFRTEASNCIAVDLMSKESGEGVGVLRLNRSLRDWSPISAKTCHLVEVSAGRLNAGYNGEWIFDEWGILDRLWGHTDFEFYNVLCVTWKGNHESRVAYRRALGRVEKSKWDAIATEIDLTLG
jgi:hypothetical protein